jgi:hypothetical protein
MKTLIETNDEKEDIVLPLLKPTIPVYNDITITETTLLDSNNHQYNLVETNNKQIEKSVEISFDKSEFTRVTISFYNINYIIGDERIKTNQYLLWQTKIFPCWKPIPSKQILTNVSGIFTPGMNAILGRFLSQSIMKFGINSFH